VRRESWRLRRREETARGTRGCCRAGVS